MLMCFVICQGNNGQLPLPNKHRKNHQMSWVTTYCDVWVAWQKKKKNILKLLMVQHLHFFYFIWHNALGWKTLIGAQKSCGLSFIVPFSSDYNICNFCCSLSPAIFLFSKLLWMKVSSKYIHRNYGTELLQSFFCYVLWKIGPNEFGTMSSHSYLCNTLGHIYT